MTRDELIHWLENDDIQGDTPVRIRDLRGALLEITEIRVVTDGFGGKSVQLRGSAPMPCPVVHPTAPWPCLRSAGHPGSHVDANDREWT